MVPFTGSLLDIIAIMARFGLGGIYAFLISCYPGNVSAEVLMRLHMRSLSWVAQFQSRTMVFVKLNVGLKARRVQLVFKYLKEVSYINPLRLP